METPYQSHINKADFDSVYEPAEDSFLIIDALEKDLSQIKDKKPIFCLEVGCGSGVVITALAMAVPNCVYFSSDINTKACIMSKSTAEYNKVDVEVINMNLTSQFVDGKFDLIIFNPPYVVTESSNCKFDDISASWAGGIKGREITDQLLHSIPKKLTMNGVFYLLLIKDNIPSEVIEIMRKYGFSHEIVIERRVRNEQQLVLKFFRQQQ